MSPSSPRVVTESAVTAMTVPSWVTGALLAACGASGAGLADSGGEKCTIAAVRTPAEATANDIEVASLMGMTETLSTINVDLPAYLDAGKEIFDSVRSGLKKAAEEFSKTAAIVSPVGQIFCRGKELLINGGKTGPVTEKLYNQILEIQYGIAEDPFGWRLKIA